MCIPPYATIGAEILALGNHAGGTKLYLAKVTAHRAKFPRIVIRYLRCQETRATHALALPTPVTAYVHAGLISDGL